MGAILEEIATKHFASVPFSLSHQDLSAAAEAYMRFLTLPDSVKQSFSLKAGVEHNFGIIGYKDRRQEEGRDRKEFFHYHPHLELYFETHPHRALSEVQEFFKAAREVDRAAAGALRGVLEELSNEFPHLIEEYFPSGQRRTLLRFLKYDVAGTGAHLAQGHYDSGGCTLALAESAPGLRLGTCAEDLQPVVHQDHTALFMPALRLHTVTDERFHPVWHDVVQASADTYSDTTARWAIVFFADGASQKTRPTPDEIFTPRTFFS